MQPPMPQFAASPTSGSASGLGLLWQAALRCALWLAILSTAVGLAWRIAGSAPDLALVLDGAGLALWLCAWPLAQALSKVRERQQRHGGGELSRWRGRLAAALHLWAVGAILAPACAGILLGYEGKAQLIVLDTLDPYSIRLPIAWFSLAVLLLAGPPAVAMASTLLMWLKRLLGAWGGLYTWTALALIAHLPLLAGTGAGLLTWSGLDLAPLSIPLTFTLSHDLPIHGYPLGLGLGQYAADLLDYFAANTQIAGRYAYLETLLQHSAAGPAMALLLAVLGQLAFALLPVRNVLLRWQAPWAAGISLLAVGLAQGALMVRWLGQPGLRYPAPLIAVLTLGLTALWLAQAAGYLIDPRRERLGLTDAVWTLIAAAGWLALTMPQLAAGQATFREAIAMATLAAVVGLLGQALISHLARLTGGSTGGWLACGLVLVIAVPVSPAGSANFMLLDWLGRAWTLPALPGVMLAAQAVLLLVTLALWPWPRRQRRGDHSPPGIG